MGSERDMNLTGDFFNPRRKFVPPVGWDKYNKSFSFQKTIGDVRMVVRWEGLEKLWLLVGYHNGEVFFEQGYAYSYDCFKHADELFNERV